MSGEVRRSFECFGGWTGVRVSGAASQEPERAATAAEARLLAAHRRLSRFLPESELSRFNRDPRATVPAGALLLELAAAAREAGRLSDGLVDATLLSEIERAGYRESRAGQATSGPLPDPVERRPAAASPARRWCQIAVDRATGTVTRPPGLAIDSGGLAKGLLADRVAAALARFPAFAVDCCGDVRVGGSAGRTREVLVEDPAGGEPIHALALTAGGIATSGITRRSWTRENGEPSHHLLDPATGQPAFTGVVQATALAPTAFLAEVHSKWALLSGPDLAPARLPYGGVLVFDDGGVRIVEARGPETAVAA